MCLLQAQKRLESLAVGQSKVQQYCVEVSFLKDIEGVAKPADMG